MFINVNLIRERERHCLGVAFAHVNDIIFPGCMEPIPLPSHVHYELLLQLLERKTLAAAHQKPAIRGQVQELIISLRKALSQQRQLERVCSQTNLPFEYHWSLNSIEEKRNNGLGE